MWTTDWTPPVTGTFFAAVRVEGGNPSTVGTRVLFVYISPNTKQLRRSEGWNLQAWRYYLLKLLPLHAFERKQNIHVKPKGLPLNDMIWWWLGPTKHPILSAHGCLAFPGSTRWEWHPFVSACVSKRPRGRGVSVTKPVGKTEIWTLKKWRVGWNGEMSWNIMECPNRWIGAAYGSYGFQLSLGFL